MNHQYWLIRNAKKLQRKFNGKEDESIVASDNELDSKLELFKSINESTSQLCNILEKYKDGLAQLSDESNVLGNFLRDCGKMSNSSEKIMVTSGKVIAYLGSQDFTAMQSINRTLSELNTFKRAVNDTKETIVAMEKERTEYRSALSLMKICGGDIDPDSGKGLEKFRTSQKYVKFAKQKFDKHSLACLQKIDLLAAARCNLFSHSLASYQTNWMTISEKNLEVLRAHVKLMENEPRKHKFGILKELAAENEKIVVDEKNEENDQASKLDINDKDQRLFFGDEFSDAGPSTKRVEGEKEGKTENVSENVDTLIDYEKEFDDELMKSSNILLPSQLLMDDSFFATSSGDSISQSENFDLLSSLVPQKSTISRTLLDQKQHVPNEDSSKTPQKKGNNNDVSKWFSLFSDLDPLNQQLLEQDDANKNLHAA